MTFELKGESVTASHNLEELKLVYRILHNNLSRFPELMDTHFLIELQNFLQARAGTEDVDVSDHGAWDRWLGNPQVACDVRMANRREIQPGQS